MLAMRAFVPIVSLALGGCSLLAWDDLIEGSGGAAGGGSATGSTRDASASDGSSSSGPTPCVGDDAASAFTITLADGVHCYRRVHDGLPWALTDLECKNRFGGHLLIIDDESELAAHAQLYPQDCTEPSFACSDDPMDPTSSRCDVRAWIGARFQGGEPVWIDDTPWTLPAEAFAGGEPNERTDPIALRVEAKIDERPPDCPHAFICEIEP